MEKKRLQVILSDEARAVVESLTKEANDGFEAGNINYSDMINEMIMSAKVDIKTLQLKHTDLRRSLRTMAAKENIDLDTIIRTLNELKSRPTKRHPKSSTSVEDVSDG